MNLRSITTVLALLLSSVAYAQGIMDAGSSPRNYKLLLYPNPVVYMTNIQLPFAMAGTVYVDVLDLSGRHVHKSYDVYWSNMLVVDMSNFPPGQYVMKVYAVNLGIHSLRVEKQ